MPLTRSILPALLASLCFGALSASASPSDQTPHFLRGLQESDCTDCEINGVGYCYGDTYPNPMCLPNTCSCTDGPAAPCTMMACERNCDGLAVCTHDGKYYCEGDQFYDTSCMPNTCRCTSNGGVACTKMACATQCTTDDDCEAVVRTESAQPDLYPTCQCEARSTVEDIASRFSECLGEGADGATCVTDDTCSGDECQGLTAVCSTDNKCVLASASVSTMGTTDAEECKGCLHNGICHDVGDQYLDACNTCTCGAEDGTAACTMAACEPCTACEDQYCVDEQYLAADGCNTCTCSGPNNTAACTMMVCPDVAMACTDDVKDCGNDVFVNRDPNNNCEFLDCPVACAMDVKDCGNDIFVDRDPNNNCEFPDCPVACAMDVFDCGNDTFVNRDPNNNCEFPDCPVACAMDVKDCGNDIFVDRDPNNNCEFPDCPVACAMDVKDCGNDVFVNRDPNNNCEFPDCPVACAMDVKDCGNDVFVDRDPNNNCEFPDCPVACAMDVKDCGNDVFVNRDPNNNCQFPACPVTTMSTTDCEGCKHNGVCIAVGDGYLDGCNQCTCSGTGVSLCTEMACPNCTACEGQYCVGEVFLAEDGCNTCTCGSEDGMATCTMMACPETPPTTCENNGITYDVGQSFVDECNTCECTEQGAICTLMACECTACKGANNETYCVGEVFADDCNTCTCGNEDGLVMCTVMACPNETAVPTVSNAGPTCENNGITYNVGEFYMAGCNSCECTDTGSACTKMACDCTACEGEYCVGEVFLADDGCNTCSCGSEDGIVMCTQMSCPEVACTQDVKDCGNDVYVSRDPNNNCEFPDCPVACAMDVKDCGNDVFVDRDPNNNCEFPDCPVTTQQTGEDVPSSATMIVIGSGSILLFLNSLAIVAINLF